MAALALKTVPCPLCGSAEKRPGPSELWDWNRPELVQRFGFSLCAQCDSAYLDPRPVNLDEVYPEDYHKHRPGKPEKPGWRTYFRRMLFRAFLDYPPAPCCAGFWRWWLRAKWERFLAEHPHLLVPWAGAKQGRLLDVGAAAGDKTAKFAALGWRVTGVETDAEAVALGRKIHGLDLRAGLLDDQGFETDSFDAATLLCVLEHVPAPVALLQEVHRVLTPGGALLIQVPNWDSGLREVFGPAWTQYSVPEHFWLPTEATLRQAVERAGFRVTSLTHRYSVGLYEKSVAWARSRNILPPSLPDPRDSQAVRRWLEQACAAPHGELMILLGEKPR
jgi:SAM-dependent methyltransferase